MPKKNILLLCMLVLMMSVFAVMADEQEDVYYFHVSEGPTECYYLPQSVSGYASAHFIRPTVSKPKYNLKADTSMIFTYEVYSDIDGSPLYFSEFPYSYGIDIDDSYFEDSIASNAIFNLNASGEATYPYRLIYTIKTFNGDNELIATSYNEYLCPEQDAAGTLVRSENIVLNGKSDVPASGTLARNPILSDPYTAVSVTGLNFTIWHSREVVFTISAEQISAVETNPEQHTLIAQSDDAYYRFYRLTTGELQLNTGPDFEGKEFVTVFNAGGQVVKTYTIDPLK